MMWVGRPSGRPVPYVVIGHKQTMGMWPPQLICLLRTFLHSRGLPNSSACCEHPPLPTAAAAFTTLLARSGYVRRACDGRPPAPLCRDHPHRATSRAAPRPNLAPRRGSIPHCVGRPLPRPPSTLAISATARTAPPGRGCHSLLSTSP